MPVALLVEDDPGSRESLAEWIEQHGFSVRTADSVAAARARLAEEHPHLLVLDMKLPDGDGLELLDVIDRGATTEIVVITGHGSIDSAIDALHGGAVDYLTKPVELPRLRRILSRVEHTCELRGEVHALREQLRRLGRFGEIIGASRIMQPVYDQIERVGPTDATVLVQGETGTGKELVARCVHDLSRRRGGPFLPINCGAVPANLMESELFGHEKGSFTGATRSHEGIFERASGGTLFLDEVTEMPVELQVKLLRVLETGRLRRVGGDREIEVDVRLIAATNRDLNDAVAEHKLRQDLLYRLMVFPIELPPLRARGRDIDLLAQSILDELNAEQGSDKELTAAARQRLRDHDWPGNVRELQNVVQRAFIMAGEQIELPDLPLSGRREPRRPDAGEEATGGIWIEVGQSVREAERRLILATLERTDGDKKEAAELLGISLKTLYNRLHAYAAESEESGESEASGESSSEPERPAPDSPEAPPDTAASPSAG